MLCFYKCSKGNSKGFTLKHKFLDHQQKLGKIKTKMGAEIAKKGLSTLFNTALGGNQA